MLDVYITLLTWWAAIGRSSDFDRTEVIFEAYVLLRVDIFSPQSYVPTMKGAKVKRMVKRPFEASQHQELAGFDCGQQ